MEIVWAPEFGIKAADDAFTFKNGVKEIVQKHSDCKEIATFMSKPWTDRSGCGYHLGQSLWDAAGTKNLMQTDTGDMSELAKHWIAGQLKHAPALAALAAPTVNCGRR